MDIGLLVTANVQRFIKYARTTDSRYGRGTNAQISAVNAITTSMIATPPRNGTLMNNNGSSNNVSRRAIRIILGMSKGSHHILKQCEEFRLAAKEGFKTSYIFLDPKRNWQKVPNEVWA